MTKCVQCGNEIKKLGDIINEVNTISLFCCFKQQCPNFALTQVGLTEIEEEEDEIK